WRAESLLDVRLHPRLLVEPHLAIAEQNELTLPLLIGLEGGLVISRKRAAEHRLPALVRRPLDEAREKAVELLLVVAQVGREAAKEAREHWRHVAEDAQVAAGHRVGDGAHDVDEHARQR